MSDTGRDPRVMVVIDSLGQGGAEQSMFAVLPRMAGFDIKVEMVLLRSVAPDREDALRDAGVPVRVLDLPPSPLQVARGLRSVLQSERPDLLHVTLFDPVIGGSIAAIGTGVPVLASVVNTVAEVRRGGTIDSGGPRWKLRLAVALEGAVDRWLATHLHAVTPGVCDSVVRRYHVPPGRITVAERGRDGYLFHPPTPQERAAARARLDVRDEDRLLIALGRHEPSKGFPDLVEAVGRLVHAWPHARLGIAGREGSMTAELRELITTAGLSEHVTLLGNRPDPEQLLAAADVFVLSSRREGTAGAALEAMATGLPMVTTELEGLAGIIRDGVEARTVPVAHPVAMAEGIDELLRDPATARRLGAAARRTFEARFTLERSAESLAALYRDVASHGRRGARRSPV